MQYRKRKWSYDRATDRYALLPAQLANLDIGSRTNAAQGARNREVIKHLYIQGLSAAEIVEQTELSRATVYRHIAKIDPLLL